MEDILKNIDNILTRNREGAIETLKPFVKRKPREHEIFACFELFHMQDYPLNYNTFSLKKDNTGHTVLDTDWNPVDENLSTFIPSLEDYLEDFFSKVELSEKDDQDFTERHEDQLFKWFAECWESAGGQESLLPTFFCFEKDYNCRDMKTGEIISEVEAAKRLGYVVEA